MKEVVSLKNAGIYQEGVKVLREVNLSVSQAEFVYLIGKTGSGKSSLMRTLWGDLPLREDTDEFPFVEGRACLA